MRKALRLLTIAGMALAMVSTAEAATKVFVGGQARTRFEIGDESVTAAGDWDKVSNVLQRVRLKFVVDTGNGVKAVIVPQYAGYWGETNALDGASSNVEGSQVSLHEGYINLNAPFGVQNAFIKLGRQEVNLGIGRVVSSDDYVNTGRSLDGLMAGYKTPFGLAAAFAGKISEKDVTGISDVNLGIAAFQGDFKPLGLGGNWDVEYVDSNSKTLPWTAYLRVAPRFKLAGFDIGVSGEYAKQGGKNLAGGDYKGYFYAVGADSKVSIVNFALGYEVYSGSKLGTTDSYQYQPILMETHKFFGESGFFENYVFGGGAPAFSGARVVVARLSAKPMEKVGLGLDYFYVQNFQRMAGVGAKLGQEVDAKVSYEYNKNLSFDTGLYVIMPDKGTVGTDDTGTRVDVLVNYTF